MPKVALIVAGIIFGIMALIHLYRLFSPFSITIGTTEIPHWGSILFLIIAGGLSYWMFTSALSFRN